jgi:hypothetical protein
VEIILAFVIGILFAAGLYMMLRRSLVKLDRPGPAYHRHQLMISRPPS